MTLMRTADAFLVLVWLPFTFVWLIDMPSPVFGALACLGLVAAVAVKIRDTAALAIARTWLATRCMRTAGLLISVAGWLLKADRAAAPTPPIASNCPTRH